MINPEYGFCLIQFDKTGIGFIGWTGGEMDRHLLSVHLDSAYFIVGIFWMNFFISIDE